MGSFGLDLGCGNGKYMSVNPNVYILGSDHSTHLTEIALANHATEKRHADALVADGLSLPFPNGRADFAISIAVIHHFSTRVRRVLAVSRVLETIRPGGQALIYVWALEQENSRRGYKEGMEQDVLVPWVLKKKKGEGEDEVKQRYYHLYKEGELEEDVKTAGGMVLESGYSKDNWYSIITK